MRNALPRGGAFFCRKNKIFACSKCEKMRKNAKKCKKIAKKFAYIKNLL